MRRCLLSIVCIACIIQLHAQTPAPDPSSTAPAPAPAPAAPAPPATFTSDAGFSYTYPGDWEVVDSKPILPALQMKLKDQSSNEMEKKGIDCAQLGLILRHGTPRSSIVIVILPYGCVDHKLKQDDLPEAASGVAEGLKKSWDIRDPIYSAYKLGNYSFWAERSHGSPKSQAGLDYTVEVSCGMLKTAMVCWMGFAADSAGLTILENGQTSIDGGPAGPLVPATAFKNSQR